MSWPTLPLMALLLTVPMARASAYDLPADRRIDWSLAGARSDWTTRSTLFTTLSPSGGNDAPAITAAIAACPPGQVVKLGPGSFKIGSAIAWGNHPHVTLRGSGKGVTILQGQAGFATGALGSFFDFYSGRSPDYDWAASPAIALSAGLAKDSTRIISTGNHGWVAGDYVLIDQANDVSGNPPDDHHGNTWLSRSAGTRLRAQVVQVTNVVSPTAVEIDPPLYFTYSPGRTPQGIKATAKLEGISIESLTVDNHASDAAQMFCIYNLFDSLFYDLDLDGIPAGKQSRHFHLYDALWLTIRRCEIHGGEGDQTNQGYGIFFGYATSGNLVEDNIFHEVILATAFEGATTGNVIAYNYTFGSRWYDTSANRLMIINHGGGSMNLIEGNVIQGRYREDCYFATGHWNCVFRNRIEQMRGAALDQTNAFDIEQGHHYISALGNVLGTSGWETTYEQANTDGAGSSIRAIYRLGYTGPWDAGAAGNDLQVKATMLRHGNWDSVHGAAVWDPAISDHSLPKSLYLTAKPTWFGSAAWPSFGPDLTSMTNRIPAQLRHEGGTVNTAPVANAQSVTVNKDTAKAITLSGSDVEGSALTFAIVANPTHGALSGSGASRTYTPTTGYTGTDSFTFTVGDGAATSSAATVAITISGSTSTNLAPTVSAATATPSPVTTTTTSLSATASDDGGETALTYAWSASGPAAVTFSRNGSNAAKASTATFTKAGSYTITVTAKDAGNLTSARSVTVTVQAAPTTLSISPTGASVQPGLTVDFNAVVSDQFALALATQPTPIWTVSGGGTIAANGLFTAGAGTPSPSGGVSATTYVVTATAGPVNSTALVTVSTASTTLANGGSSGQRCGGGSALALISGLGLMLAWRRRR